MNNHSKVTDTLEWGTIEHLVKRQIPRLQAQLTEKSCDLDEQDGEEVLVDRDFLADIANALDAAQEQFRAIRPYLREAVSVEAVARHGREGLWDTLSEQAKQRHLEAARDVIAAAGFTPVDSVAKLKSGDDVVPVSALSYRRCDDEYYISGAALDDNRRRGSE